MKQISFVLSIFLLQFSFHGNTQMNIAMHRVNPLFCAPENLLDINLVNPYKASQMVAITSTLFDAQHKPLIVSKSELVEIMPGSNTLYGRTIIQEYIPSDLPAANYLLSHRQLLEGNYELCIQLTTPNAEFPIETCFPIVSTYNSFLQLVQPSDKSIIEEKNPTLVWMHSGDFTKMDVLENFELVLVEKHADQSPEQALAENELILYLPKVNSHSILYPLNATPLAEGKQYAWRVIHKYQDILIESSDAWWFEIAEWEDPRDLKYVDIRNSSSSAIVEVYHSFYFRFDETYNSSELKIQLMDENLKLITPTPDNDNPQAGSVKKNGFNGYKLDLTAYQLKAGYYIVSVLNGKGEEHKIKIHYNK